MAGKKQFPNGTWQYIFKRKGVLEKPLYLTFDSEEEGDDYARKLEALLDRGIVPIEHQTMVRVLSISQLIGEYERDAHPSDKDRSALNTIAADRGNHPLTDIDANWVDAWITELKRIKINSPATIRAKVGALARCTDWGMRKGLLKMPDHPLRTLPDGYAQYTKMDEVKAGVKKEDVERDRRLEAGEFEAISELIAGGVLARKQRPLRLEPKEAFHCMFVLALESAMRLREIYTLSLGQVDFAKRTVFLDKTKNGDKRQVPLTTVAVAELKKFIQQMHGDRPPPSTLLFPFWDGATDRKTLHRVTDKLSSLFVDIFEQAGAADLGFHDLRHEATSRLFERTTLSETAIMKITGHKSQRMLMRYANLRGTTLADALW